MNRQDLVAIGERSIRRLIKRPPQAADVYKFLLRTTSGVTGKPIAVVWEHRGRLPTLDGVARPIALMGSMNSRLFHALAARHRRVGETICIVIPDSDDMSAGTLMADFAPDSLRGLPSLARRWIRILDTSSLRGVRSIILTGEVLTKNDAELFRTAAPAATIKMSYGTAELGRLSGPFCAHLSANQYHPAHGVDIEIENPDESGAGDVLVSATLGGGERIDRYLVGDVARFLPPCECGEGITFEILGRRGYDYIKIAGALLVREEIERVMRMFPYVIDYRVLVSEISSELGPVGNIEMRCWAGGITKKLEEEFTERFAREIFLTPTQTLAQLMKQELFRSKVWFEKGPFSGSAKDIKIRRIDD